MSIIEERASLGQSESQLAVHGQAVEGFGVLPVERSRAGGQVMLGGIAVSNLLNGEDPLSQGQRKLAVDQVNQADLRATTFIARLGFNEVLWSASRFPAVRLAHTGKPSLVPRRRRILQRLVALVPDAQGGVECPVKGIHGIAVM